MHLQTGSPEKALRWLTEQPESSRSRWRKHEQVLLRTYKELGMAPEARALARQIFEQSTSLSTLDQLIDIIGETHRAEIIDAAVGRLLGGPFDLRHVYFFLDVGRIAEAADFVVERRAELDGDNYSALPDLANRMAADQHWLAATCIYRALLESILARARTKAYGHGVRHLKSLGALADRVTDWRAVEPPAEYLARIYQAHRLKKSFWSRVTKAGLEIGP